ncbi:hypothetical protein EOM57_04605 [Candidatus Saccharibacteria bacterium]|nr:hypothetical protein [Candidatus Saccharibacteria bacterium]
MIYEIIDYLNSNPKIKKIIIVSFFAVISVFVLLFLADTPTSKPLELTISTFPNDSFAKLQGSYLYSFNGLYFQKTDVRSGKTTTLSKGARWPVVNSVYWAGDSGAIVTISRGFSYSPAEQLVNNLPVKSTEPNVLQNSYIWYIDFASGTMSSIDSRRPENNSYSYDNSVQKLYYVAVDSPVDNQTEQSISPSNQLDRILYSFDTKNKSLTELSKIENISYISNVSPCNEELVCIIGRNLNNKNVILSYSKADKITTVYETIDTITPTNDPTRFLITKETADNSENNQVEGYIYSGPYSYDIYNLTTQKTEKTGISNAQSNYTIPFYSDGKLTLYASIGGGEVSVSHRSRSALGLYITKNSVLPATSKNYTTSLVGYSTSPVGFIASGSQKDTLVYTANLSLPKKPTKAPTNLVQKCAEQYNSISEYTDINSFYSLYVPIDNNFAINVDNIAQCIFKQPNDISGYTFETKGTDPGSGRIATD